MRNMESLREQIYNIKATFERIVSSIERDETILESNRKLILEYKNHCTAKGLSEHRIMLLMRHLKLIGRLCPKNFKAMERKDMEAVMAHIEGNKKYSQWTKETFKIALKTFYRWMYDLESTDTLPDVVKWIKCTKPPNRISKDELLTRDEIAAMLSKCNNVMKRAMISVLYEGALRPLELLTMRIKDVIVENKIIRIKVRGKMEKKQGDREVFLFRSYDSVKEWLSQHPFKDTPEHPMWIVLNDLKFRDRKSNTIIDLYGKPLSMRYLNYFVKDSAKEAGIKKKVYPYLFRHSQGTNLYREIGEALAKQAMGHAPDSRMARVYNHLNNEDLLQALMKSNGVEGREEDKVLNSCPKCRQPIPYGAVECRICGLPLTTERALEVRANEGDLMKTVESKMKEMLQEELNRLWAAKEKEIKVAG